MMYLNVLTIFYCTCLYMWMRKKINRVIYYTVKIGFLYTLYIKRRWERERDPFRSTITHQCFSLLRSHFSARIFKFSTTTFVYEYITRMACWLCWLQGEWWRELKKHAPETSHENQPLPQSPSDLCPMWGLPDWCYDHCWMPPFL